MLFRFLKIQAIFNGTSIYQLEKNKSVVIGVADSYSTLVITDGFHYTRTLEIKHQYRETSFLTVFCILDDNRLIAGLILTFLFYLSGLTSGILFIRLLSFMPTLYFLYCFYINKRSFIKVKREV